MSEKERNQARKNAIKKELKLYNICVECGIEYKGNFARFFFRQLDTKKKKIIKGVCICDDCLSKRTSIDGVWAVRTKNI